MGNESVGFIVHATGSGEAYDGEKVTYYEWRGNKGEYEIRVLDGHLGRDDLERDPDAGKNFMEAETRNRVIEDGFTEYLRPDEEP